MNLDLGIGDYSSLYALANRVRMLATQIQAAWTQDHAQGDWSPTIGSIGGGTPVYTVQSGHWVKIAPGLVFVQCFIEISSVGSLGAGQLYIGNLPFFVKAGLNDEAPAQILWHNLATSWVRIIGQGLQAHNQVHLNGITGASGSTFTNIVAASDLAAGSILKMSMTYRTNS
jgi:hypothetical protein